jgi:hypothetical protein
MVGCDGRNWHQRIADYRLYADGHSLTLVPQSHQQNLKGWLLRLQRRRELALEQYKELVAKISQDAKERRVAGNNQYTERPTAQGREGKTGEATEVLAEIAGTGK